MIHHTIDAAIEAAFAQDHPFLSYLHTAFGASYASELQAMRPRFAPRHDKDKKISNGRIIDLFGIDCDHQKHPIKQLHILQQIISTDRSSTKIVVDNNTYSDLCITSVVHDMAEALVGDIAYGDKSRNDEIDELNKLEIVLGRIARRDAGWILGRVLPVLSKENMRAAEIFDISERVGYFETGINAGRLALLGKGILHQDEIAMGSSMAKDVTRRHLEILQGHRNVEYIDTLLADSSFVTAQYQELNAAA